MSLLVETIKVNDGKIYRLPQHNDRFNKSRRELWSIDEDINLADHIIIPSSHQSGLFKCRVVYGEVITRIELLPYQLPKITSVKLIDADDIDYHLKYTDRRHLASLYELRGDKDDILIVKNGCVTDAYYANVAFSQKGLWYTPELPLLEGCQRAELLQSGSILTRSITPSDIKQYDHLCLFNAMIELGEIRIDIRDVSY